MLVEASIIIIDFKKDRCPLCLEASEIMLLMWVVSVAEIIKHGDGLKNPVDSFLTEGGDARSHYSEAP